MGNLHRVRSVVVCVVTCLLAGSLPDLVRAQTCEQPACTFTNPPASGTTTTRYDLSARTTPANCSFSYKVDCGYGTPAWGSTSNELCTYPAVGGTAGRTYAWAISVGNPSKTYCSKSGSTTVYDCQLGCGAATVPATGEVGVPITFGITATASHCLDGPTFSWDVPGFSYCAQSSCQYTFATPGVYPWRVVVTAKAGTNPTSYQSCRREGTITISAGGLKVGSITFKADTIVQQSTDYTLTGHVRANDVLLFSDQVTFRGTPSSGKGELLTDGGLSVATQPGPTTIISGANQRFLVDGTASTGKLRPQGTSYTTLGFSLAGLPLYLDWPETITEMRLSGRSVSIDPAFYIGKIDGFTLASARVATLLTPGSPPEVTGVDLVNGSEAPGVQIDGFTTISYDGRIPPGTLTGILGVRFPPLQMTAGGVETAVDLDLVVENGCVNSLEKVASPIATVSFGPQGKAGAFLELSSVKVTGICDPTSYAPLMTGTLRFGQHLTIEDSAWLYLPPRNLLLMRGTMSFLGRPLRDPRGGVTGLSTFDLLALQGTFGIGGLPDGADVLRGTLMSQTASRQASEQDDWTSFGWLDGSFVLSESCPCPDTAGSECLAARAALLSFYPRIDFPGKTFSMSARGLKPQEGYEARFDGANVFADNPGVNVAVVRRKLPSMTSPAVTCWPGSNLAGRPTMRSTALLALPAAGVERSATLARVEDLAIFGVQGKGTTLPRIYLTTPGGQRLTPTTAGQLSGAAYATDAGARLALFAVKRAAAGTWVIGEDNLPESQVTFTVLAPQPPPVTTFTSVRTTGVSTAITATVAPPSAGTTVALYYSRTPGGLPDGEIAGKLSAGSGTVTATWDTSALPSGVYYLFAVTEDGRNGPVTTTHATPITVDVGGLNPPTNLKATRNGEVVTLTWSASTSTAVVGYEVRYTDSPDVPGYPFTASAPLATGMTLGNLGYTRGYRLCVAAFDLSGSFSPCSSTVVVGPGKGRVRRHLS